MVINRLTTMKNYKKITDFFFIPVFKTWSKVAQKLKKRIKANLLTNSSSFFLYLILA
ncbi:Uncharacterised protein [Sphingobacterium multivorum]|nr:Uncharacterised protein [Sphingobacterium multivorum]